jgi:phosphohistidine phosphatase
MAARAMGEAELLVLRHGIAEERGPDRDDATRALTARGRERTAAVARRALELGLTADRLVSSPLTRAWQTAAIAAEAGLAPAPEASERLRPGGDPLPLLQEWLRSPPRRPDALRRLLIVGHEPDLGLLAARLIGAPAGAIALRKGGLAVLRFAGEAAGGDIPPVGGAQLQLLLTPRVLLR